MSEVLKKTVAAVFDVSTALVDQSQVWGGVNSEKAVFFILTWKIKFSLLVAPENV